MSTSTELQPWTGATALPALPLAASDAYLRPGLSATQIVTILWAYRKLSFMIAVAVLALTVLVLMAVPRTYEATATVLVNYEVNDPLTSKEFPIGLLSSYIATQAELMQNPDMLLKVVDKLNLTQDKDYRSGYHGASGASLREYVQKRLSKDVKVTQGELGSHLINITAGAHTPQKAALIANAIMDIYKEQETERANGPAVERAKRYAVQLKSLAAKVGQAQEQYTAFHQRNGLLESDDKGDVETALLADLERQLVEAEKATRLAESRSAGDLVSSDQVMASQMVQTMKSQLAQLESKLAELQITLGPRHPQVIEINSQIAATRANLAREIDAFSKNAQGSLRAAQQLEARLRKAVAAQREKVMTTSQLRDQAAKYRLDLESAQAVYKRALDGYDQVMFASIGDYTNIDIISRATPPVKSSKPKIPLFIALGAMAALGLGLFLPLVYELTNRRMRCRDDFERDNGVPVLVEFDPLPMIRSHA